MGSQAPVSGKCSSAPSPAAPLYKKPMSDLQKLHELILKLKNISELDANWKYKYERIFNEAREIRTLIASCGLSFDYYDPDGSYEDDCKAYIEALLELNKNIEAELMMEME